MKLQTYYPVVIAKCRPFVSKLPSPKKMLDKTNLRTALMTFCSTPYRRSGTVSAIGSVAP